MSAMAFQVRDATEPEPFDTWRPFLLAARAARRDRVPYALDPLDFDLAGWLTRKGKDPLWLYVRRWRPGELCVNPDGVPFLATVDRAGRTRTREIGIFRAVMHAGAAFETYDG